jgi:hypothetical protein
MEIVFTENKDLINHVVQFYKKIFGKEPRENMQLDDNFWVEDEKVTQEENVELEKEFSAEEVKNAIDESYAKGVLDPDGFFLFYQKF